MCQRWVTELVTAEDSRVFYDYLTDKGLDLPSDSRSVFDEYIGEEYIFVVSWISDVEKFKEESTTEYMYGGTINNIGVFIKFPTDKIYFPLKPTSVYGDMEVPILIYVINHVTPKLYTEIEKETEVNYLVGSYGFPYYVPEELSSFFNGKTRIDRLEYTKIKISVPSKYLTEDLWIENYPPNDVVLSDFINRSALIWGRYTLYIIFVPGKHVCRDGYFQEVSTV